jgi:dihydrolipoamide dehydrogenase
MIQIADDYHRRKALSAEGIARGEDLSIHIRASLAHVRALRDDFVGGLIADVIEPLGDKFVEGYAEFVEATVLKVGQLEIVADKVVIATGSRPVIPGPWKTLADRYLTTDTIFEQNTLPHDMAVIGLGAIGLELGQALKRMGFNVTGFDRLETIGGLRDPQVSRAAVEMFAEELPVHLGTDAEIETADARLRITAGGRTYSVDKVLLSVGRAPNIDGLHIERLGVELDDRGLPDFDRTTMQVRNLPVFIAGDVADYRPILHEVAHEGTVAGYNAVHDPVLGFKRKTPLAICFSDPNVCSVGASWDNLKDTGPAIGTAEFDGGREQIMLRPKGMIRIYADAGSGRLLGAEMVAPHGEHLAHQLAWSIQQNLTVFDLLSMPYYHPTVEESLKSALLDLLDGVRKTPRPLPGYESL